MAHRTETLADGVTLILGDCREVLPTLGRVDAVVTSPPYLNQRDYELSGFNWYEVVPYALRSITSDDAQILVNLGLIYKDGAIVPYWDGLSNAMTSDGWRLFGWYVWDKGFGAPGDWRGRLAPAHEWIFHFNKSPRPVNKWIKTQERRLSGTGLRKPDGKMSGISSPEKCGQPFKVPDSVIRTPPHQMRGGIENEHPAIWPVALAEHLIRSFTVENDTVCDPFAGSGTTGVAAVKLGRKFTGVEIEPRYFDIACRRISEALKQPNFFIEKPAPAKQEALEV